MQRFTHAKKVLGAKQDSYNRLTRPLNNIESCFSSDLVQGLLVTCSVHQPRIPDMPGGRMGGCEEHNWFTDLLKRINGMQASLTAMEFRDVLQPQLPLKPS